MEVKLNRFVVVYPSGAVRGSYGTRKLANEAVNKLGLTIVEIDIVDKIGGKLDVV